MTYLSCIIGALWWRKWNTTDLFWFNKCWYFSCTTLNVPRSRPYPFMHTCLHMHLNNVGQRWYTSQICHDSWLNTYMHHYLRLTSSLDSSAIDLTGYWDSNSIFISPSYRRTRAFIRYYGKDVLWWDDNSVKKGEGAVRRATSGEPWQDFVFFKVCTATCM
jgi:hypothetical protein